MKTNLAVAAASATPNSIRLIHSGESNIAKTRRSGGQGVVGGPGRCLAPLPKTVLALALCGLGFAYARSAPTNAPSSALPYYESRDFTPRWREVNHRVEAFHLLDQGNHAVSEQDLDGKIHVASFLFARCPNLCPTLVQKLKPVQDAIRGQSDVVMVSYTVTPTVDTPEVLAEFGRLRGIDPLRWRLLTGELSQIKKVIRESYFADDDRPIDGVPQSRLLHSEKVLLVDRDRHLRGIYNGTNAFEMERLVGDIAALRLQ